MDILFPRQCAGCARPDHSLCPACAEALARPHWVSAALPALASFDGSVPFPVLAGGQYAGDIRRVITAWKSGQRPDVGKELCVRAATTLAELFASLPALSPQLVIAAPSGWRRRMSGKLVTRDLARASARALGIPCPDILRRTGARQRGASARRRAHNRRSGTFLRPGASDRFRGATAILIDDVVTTGATLAGAAQTLEKGGITPIMAYVLAAAPPVDSTWATAQGTPAHPVESCAGPPRLTERGQSQATRTQNVAISRNAM